MEHFKKIVGERIYLSPMCMDDAYKFLEYVNDLDTARGVNQVNKVNGLLNEQKFIEKSLANGNYIFSIIKLEDDKLIGNCSIMNIDFISKTGTIGIMIGEDKSKGYGTECLNLLLDYGFNFLNLNNINLGVFSFNERAIKCYKKVGFKEYGTRHNCCYYDGKYYDEIFMEYLKEDFKKKVRS